MTGIPPLLLRRAVLAPVVLVVEIVLLLASPVVLALALLASPFFGAWRPLRMLAIVLSFVVRHFVASLACLGLWFASGFGRRLADERMQRVHYAVLRWFVTGVYSTVVRVAHVEVRVSESAEVEAVLSRGERPVVVLSRHAGEGDTLLVLDHLLGRHGRRPRVVMHEALRLDPLIDVLGGRLPNRFVDPHGGDTEVEIAAMSSDLEDSSAVLIFPEGGNFSAGHRQKGIERLEDAGHEEQAGWARGMQHMSAPRPGGALAAIDAAPGVDVVFAGHVGSPRSLGEVWRLLPHDQTVEMRLWLAAAGEVPAGYEERIDWLFGWWRTLDTWVAERHEAGGVPGVVR
jgi:1-acyl-sn-glycerol-3-phosphate acyltransferase